MMLMMSERLHDLLEAHAVTYHVIVHRRDYTAQGAAADTRTPGRDFAKAVVLAADHSFIMAVLPAHHRVDLTKIKQGTHAHDVHLASEPDLARLFPDCEVGSEPPFGHLYGLPVLMSLSLAGEETITFNAGNHEVAIRMRMSDFCRLAEPTTMDLSTAHHE